MATRKKKIPADATASSDPSVSSSSVPQNGATNPAIKFIMERKKEMKESQYRKQFDTLFQEIKTNLVNTKPGYGEKLYERSGWNSVMTYTKTADGNTDMNVYPQKLNGRDQNRSGVPVTQEPIGFSKIIIATSVLAGALPDATAHSDDPIYSRAMYELWKKQWEARLGNGLITLENVYQNLFTYGWAAWRVYPRQVQVKRSGVEKIIFSDIFREAMDPARTWLGVGFNNYDIFSQFEVYYEKDMPKSLFIEMYPQAAANEADFEYCGVSEESKEEDNDNQKTDVTIGYYENVLTNRFIVACGKMLIYDGELPNDDSFGSIVVAQCFNRGMNDPYGVGLYELMRGNTAVYTYINSLNAQQVEAEIFPLLFGAQVQNGTSTYKRGPNIVNPKTPGTDITVVNTKGNIQGGIAYANQQKTDIEDNTGVNNIVAGQSSEDTLGSTVILKEAALNRLVLPRNSVVAGLELDALISNSWTKQTYSVDKVFLVSDDDSLKQFVQNNPDYFVKAQPIMDGDDFKGYAVAASPNLRLNFDFDKEGNLMENVSTRKISAKGMFDEMKDHGHTSPYICFIIDPTSMLLPSIEIDKQQFGTNFPVVTNQITLIFSLRNKDPDAAASQLMALEQYCEKERLDIYKFIMKSDYDAIMAKQPSQAQIKMMQMEQQGAPQEKSPVETLNYKDAPPDVQRQIEAQAGLTPSADGGGIPPATAPIPGAIESPIKGKVPMGQRMMPGQRPPLQPINQNSVPKPQGALGSSNDASVGYAAKLPFTPNK